MSYESRIFQHQNNINRYLKGLGSHERFDEVEKKLLSEYQSIGNLPYEDQIFERGCAEEAFAALGRRDMSLTEYGVSFAKGVSIYVHTQEKKLAEEKKYGDELAQANKTFLRLWDEIRKRKRKEIEERRIAEEEIQRAISETKAKINANTSLLSTARKAAEMLMREGYKLDDPSVLETPPAEAICHGLKITATNVDGVQREISLYLPGGEVRTVVHVPNELDLNCQEAAEGFRNQIGQLIEDAAASCGTSITADYRFNGPEGSGPRGGSANVDPHFIHEQQGNNQGQKLNE